MDARTALRQYLAQRHELGERELVLDSMTRKELARLVSASRVPATGRIPDDAPPGDAPRAARPAAPAVREPAPSRPASAAGGEFGAGDSDWRAALRATGAAADSPSPTSMPRLPAPAPATSGAPIAASLDTLDAIAEAVKGCTRCPLYATATNAVPGEGNPNADLMVVGEAPGATEDETGRPFIGAAGQLLTKILEAVNIPRDQAFICNVLKHRPPGNRNPAPEEVVACSPYLLRQIELVRPKVILALGTFAAQTLLDTRTPIGKLRGQVHQYHGVPLVVTYHPAALLRNPAWKRPTWEDVQLARRILDSAPDLGA